MAFLSKAKSGGRIRDYNVWSRLWCPVQMTNGYLRCQNADSNEAFGKFEPLS
ncbi:hypothetical protein [Limosilactobacillus reuteri]|uniref:hypothetical protein n=1 Tax=Limosilactobacillus reuteri TaxID=1598 RepID=UPI0015C635BF|nr:hypothetical protein [Limosilactobacillus reuteri]MCR1863927.1 hypothetical protein [Limosilactobacillus reuteri]MCR1893682.1 hypothetical protein [Limosilactobacillus reuteri]